MDWSLWLNGLYFFFQALYEYVLCNSYITGPFGIFSTFPRAFIGLEQMVRDIEGILTVEEGEHVIAPLSLTEMVRKFMPCIQVTLGASGSHP